LQPAPSSQQQHDDAVSAKRHTHQKKPNRGRQIHNLTQQQQQQATSNKQRATQEDSASNNKDCA
jgi:hypothetical protein